MLTFFSLGTGGVNGGPLEPGVSFLNIRSQWAFSGCIKPLLLIKALDEAIDMKILFFILMQIKLTFHQKGSSCILVLKVRVFGTRKWSIENLLDGL